MTPIEKLGKATVDAAAKEFQPEIEAVRSMVEAWALYFFPVLLDYREHPDRIWEDLEKFALSALLFAVGFMFLGPFRRHPHRKRNNNNRWFKKQDSWSSFHLSPTGGSESDSRSTNDLEDNDFDDVQQFELHWPDISRSEYAALVPGLPRACVHPDNVWALRGLYDCLEQQGKTAEMSHLKLRLDLAEARADRPVKAACGCAQVAMAAG